jgi:NAD(P)-dependent dehydrogenase (short-subunit alcohol dehydrogenase family)
MGEWRSNPGDAFMAHLALVTGAGRRLGRAIALRLAREGCDIAVHYNSSEGEADRVAREISLTGRRAHAVGFDQTDDAGMDAGLAAIRQTFGASPSVLVNSASIFEWDNLSTVDRTSLTRHFEANLFGPVLLARKVVETSVESTRGLILNLLDQKLANPNPDHLSYTLSKYALQGFTTLMAQSLAPRFRVNAIAPGHTLHGPSETQEHFAAIHDQTPLLRGPTPDDIAETAAYLFNSRAVTGQTIIVDGGAHMRPTDRDFAFH